MYTEVPINHNGVMYLYEPSLKHAIVGHGEEKLEKNPRIKGARGTTKHFARGCSAKKEPEFSQCSSKRTKLWTEFLGAGESN